MIRGRHWVIAFLLVFLSGCGGSDGGTIGPPRPQFEPDGLNGLTVMRVLQDGDRLFAATSDGLYGKPIGQDAWQSLGLDGHRVQDLAVLDVDHWLAVVFAEGAVGFDDPALMETVNGGANWLEVEHDFGGAIGSLGMAALHYDPDTGRLYATDTDALAVSTDDGRSWSLIAGDWGGLSTPNDALNLNPAHDQVWVGGQNAIEEMVLLRHDLASGETESFPGLLPSPSTIKDISFDPADPDRVLASGEGGIVESLDNGATWTRLLGDVNHRFYFGVVLDPADPQTLYTVGWDKEFDVPQPLVFEVSEDGGANWASYTLDDPDLFGGAWSLLAVTEDGRTVVYIGLYRGGMMRVRPPRS
jgi:photosystem II stability/assembly factor-like uncharacterized protein